MAGNCMKVGPVLIRALVSLLWIGIWLPISGWARVSAEASLSASEVGVGEPFTLTVQVANDKEEELPWPEIAGLDGFTVKKGSTKSTGSQTTIVNGKVTSSQYYVTTFSYTLTGKSDGTFPIGPIRYRHGSFDQNLGSATVRVLQAEAGLVTTPTLSRRNVYVGEQVLYNLRIVPNEGIKSINLPQDLQKLIGERFYFQRLDKTIEPKTVDWNGKPTRLFDVRIALFPIIAGKAHLSGIPVEYQEVRRSKRRRSGSVFDMFDDEFFGGGARVVSLTSEAPPMDLQAKALPVDAPAGFNGSVGAYTLSASIDRKELPAGDALTLTVKIRGNGQPKSIVAPRLPDLADFEVFDPEEIATTEIKGSTLWSQKTFRYVMIPHQKGEYSIGSIGFSYFNPEAETFSEARSEPITVTVSAGKDMERVSARIMTQNEISQLGTDIRHIRRDGGKLRSHVAALYQNPFFWSLWAAPPVLFAFLAVGLRRRDRLKSDSALLRRTQAGSHLKKRLSLATKAAADKSGPEFYKQISAALLGFASDKLNHEFRGMLLDEAELRLKQAGASDEIAARFKSLVQHCDFGQFAGNAGGTHTLEKDLEEGEQILRRLDKELA
jgi:hypothetical protein